LEKKRMSETPVVAAVSAPGVVGQVSGTSMKPVTAIEMLEAEILSFLQQREKAVAQVHAIDGAIQATQHFLAKLRAEAAKAVAAVSTVAEEVVTEVEQTVEQGIHVVESIL
jgi:ABC-type transporter Mla subunit MlaD